MSHSTPRADRLGTPLTPREGEYTSSQLGQDIRTNRADDDDDGNDDDGGDGGGGEDDAILTRRPTRRDGARDAVRPLGLADPLVPIASINANVDVLVVRIQEQVPRKRAWVTSR